MKVQIYFEYSFYLFIWHKHKIKFTLERVIKIKFLIIFRSQFHYFLNIVILNSSTGVLLFTYKARIFDSMIG